MCWVCLFNVHIVSIFIFFNPFRYTIKLKHGSVSSGRSVAGTNTSVTYTISSSSSKPNLRFRCLQERKSSLYLRFKDNFHESFLVSLCLVKIWGWISPFFIFWCTKDYDTRPFQNALRFVNASPGAPPTIDFSKGLGKKLWRSDGNPVRDIDDTARLTSIDVC